LTCHLYSPVSWKGCRQAWWGWGLLSANIQRNSRDSPRQYTPMRTNELRCVHASCRALRLGCGSHPEDVIHKGLVLDGEHSPCGRERARRGLPRPRARRRRVRQGGCRPKPIGAEVDSRPPARSLVEVDLSEPIWTTKKIGLGASVWTELPKNAWHATTTRTWVESLALAIY
jgi:hypothetical protein